MVTIKEVAKACGVSIATVNRALSNKPDVSQKTKARVVETARAMGYRPHLMARSLARGKSMLIGMVIFDIKNPFFGDLSVTLNSLLKENGYFLHTCIINNLIEDEANALNQLAGLQVDGIFLLPLDKGEDYENFVKSLGTKVVTIFNYLSSDFNFIGVDESAAMKQAVKYIHDKGYNNLLYLSPPLSSRGLENIDTIERRFEGVSEAVNEYRFSDFSSYIEDDYCKYAIDKIERSKGRTAVLCSNDIYALDILNETKKAGLKVKSDFGLMGFDNIPILDYLDTKLTTVYYPVSQVAEEAVAAMLNLLKGNTSEVNIRFPTAIREGDTI